MASLPSHDVTLNKLDGYNYSLWSFKIEMLLQKEDLWEVVTENIPDEPKIEWKKKDSKARAIINLSIADSQIVHVKNLLTAKATWDTLKNIYERKTLSGKIYLLRKLYSLKLEEDKDMQQHITTMMELVDKLRTIGETLKDSHITAILLCSLPKSYSNLITMLESRPDDELTLEFTKNKLLDEHTRRVESSKDESTASKALKSLHGASSQRREKEKKFCSFCHKPNHSKEECWHYQKRNNSNKEYKYVNFRRGNVPKYTNQSSVTQEQSTNQRTTKGLNPKALNCTQREASVHNWFIDSGATSHMAYDESFFTELNREQTQNVVVANGNKLQAKGIGQGEIKVITPQGKTDTLLLTKVLYIPELTDNLLSVSAATSNGCKVTFNRDWCTIERDNTALANGILDNGMYRLHLDDNPQTRTFKANVAKQNHCKNKNCLMLWHDRLGHRNIESIKKIRNENLARGLSLNNCSHSTDCVQCIQGKLTETPFPKKTEYRATETLQLVHSDVCGPLPTNSLSGKRYFITFTDDYSRYTKIYLLKGKDEVYEKIKDYVISAHTEFGKNIQTIWTDNGREYVNRQVEDFLNQSGIKHQLTVPYSPAQNGVAERKNRSLMEMTRCMLFDSGLPQSLWAEAVTTANYLHNRIPSKATDKTPFELWTNRKPSLKHLKRFGCKAFAYIPKIKRNKLDGKVIEGIFLGYDDRSKGYRILHDTDNITISRSVKFIEKENGFHLASTKTTSPQVLSTDLTSSNHIGNAEESQEPGTQSENLEDSETEDYIQPSTSTGTQVVTQRRSTRPTKGIPPIRNDYMLYKTEAQDIQTPTSYSEVLQLPKIEREKWLQAMNEELNSLEKNNVWELTPLPKDKKIIGCKWTYKQKLNSKGEIERYKARLVAKGFNQKFGRDYEETFAPIVKHSTIRDFLAASVYKGMQVIHLDVKTAFLHGDLDKELYMELPEGLHTKQTNKVCKLKKAIYGLKQAGRSWNTKIASTLIKNNFKQSIVDPCLFTKNEENHSIYLILYVDDMLLASDSEIIIQNTVKTLEKEFEIKNLGDPTQFIGIEISRNREGELLLSQKNKIQELVERYNLQEAKPTFTPMESGYPGISDEKLLPNNVQYQQLIGSLLYLSVVSRPDIAAPVCILSSRNQNPRNCDWNAAKIIEDLWEVVTENIPDEPKIEWKKKDSKARAIINLSIADSQIVHVKNLLTAKATWDTLKNIYERKTLSGKIYLLRKLYSLKLEEDKDMQQHITTMMELVDKLRTIGETLKDSHITAILLCSLPKSYSNLITMLESRPDDELTLEFTKNKLLDEHTRRVESSKDESTASKALKSLHGASSQRREKEKKFCSFCHKPNHSKEECWHYQKRNNSNKEYKYVNSRRGNVPKYTNQSSVTQEQSTNQRTTKGLNPKALNCTQREASVHNWFIDSGATSHMAYDESFFTELNREQTQNVVVANGNKLQAKGIGQGEIKVITPQGKTDTLLLTKVLYIPELTDNLLSVSAATSNGCKVTFNRDWCTIERDNTALANGILDNGMYRLHLDDNPQTRTFKANVAKQNHCKNKNCLMLWHDRLGHRNIESIKKIRNENLARGLSLNNCSHSTDCVQCIQGKLTETPFPKKTEYRATETLQLVHSDVCGPLPTNSLSGKRYFITFTDDYSRYTKIYLLKGKDEVYEKIKDYVISAHTEFGKNIQTIWTDNGREYVNRQVEDFLNQSGIKHQLTVPYSPAQNGVAERKNRSLMEMTRCMLFDSGLPQSLWAEAVTTANYLHNRIPSKATDKTPFELWTNRKPSLKHLKRFGCKAFAYIPKIKRNKLDGKVIEGIFLGYDDRSKGYRILHDTDNITISRSVKFIEKENGFHLASTKTTSPQVLSTDLTSSNHIGNAEESQEPGTQSENLEDSETEDYIQPSTSTGTQVVTQRRSTRPTKGIPPIRNDYMLYKTEAQDIQTPTSYSEVLQLPKIEREKWLQAMNEELNSLEKNNVWELTPLPKDKKIIGCKWTYKQKLNSKGEIERYKARLVAKGFNQKFGRDYEETFAPIVKHSTIRDFLAASVYKGMQVIHLDVKTAFLHGDLDKELYMELPEGLHTKQTNKVCKLKKAIYGLKQAGRSWNTKIASTLIKNNFKQSIVDPCLFTKNEENHSIYLILYVDDMLLASDSEIIIQNTVKTLEKEFEIKNLGDPTQFIGIEISRNREGELLLSQKNKIQELVERYNLQEAKPTFTPMESGYPGISDEKLLPNNVQYQQLIGSLLYLSVVSRPDIAAPVCILSSRNQNPRNCDWNAAKIIEDLWEVVTENIPDEPKIEWKKKDSKARAIINLSIADSQIVHVKNLLTAKATWDTLKNIYERKTLSGKIYLLRKLYSLKLEEDKDMQQHITTMMELVDKLRTIGETLKDSHITAILLCSLPKSYSNLITMLESRPDDELTLEFTKNKLLDEHTRRVESSKDESTASKALKSLHGASSQRREKEKKFCSFCHKPNHSKEECWHYQKRNNSNKEYKYVNFRRGNVPKYTNQSSVTQEQSINQRTTKGLNPKALNCTQREASVHNWFIDSGATSHMAYDESFFTELNREQTQNVVVANGNKLQAKGIGQGEIKVITPQGKTDTLLLTKVLYIPELTDNLLSVSAATSNGCKVTFNRDWCTIERDNTALANGILDNGMYRLHLDDNPQTRTFKANVAKQNHCKNKNCLMLWHDRLGHRNIESIKKIRNENLARGLSLNNCSHSTDCVQCIQGKLTETPFPKKTEYRATETLQLVHSDVCGPLPTNSLSGKRYFITFTDDYSRYTKIYLLKGKDEVYEKIKDYVISAHTESGKNIQTIWTDNGREYVNRQVEDFLNQSGIKHQLTVPYSPAQNGVAERKNRSLMEMTRCMLFDSGLPQSLWAEAVTTANYLHNRIPSKATDKTPFELWTNRKPSLKHLKRFGCKAFAYIPKIKRNKLDGKVIEGIFLGYDDRSKGYRILHDTDNITISRSVKFIEKENGFHLASTKTTSPQVLSTDLTSSNHIGNAEESQEPGTQSENLEDSETEDYIQPSTSTGTQVVTQRRSTRPTKGIPPIRNDYMLYKTEAQDIQTPTSYSEVLQLPKIEREKWLQAMNEELNSLEKNNVWELTPLPKDKKIIGCKWTYKQKLNSKGEIERYKARLVAKGFNQKFGRDYEETFAPIVKHSTIRDFLAASVYKGMQVIHLDVKTAFLHGDLDKELYMELPEGLHTKQTNKVCKLKKAIYGLKQAGRSWNTKIASTLIKNNFKQSIVDPCLFTKNEENHSIYLILYVDDMLLASDSEIIIQNTVKTLEKEFEIKNLGDPTQFIGIEISRNREGELLLSQKNKIQELVERYNLQEAKPTFTPMESGYPGISDEKLLPNNVQYQQLIGSLLYLSVVSRPDIAAPVCILSSRNQNPRNCDWNAEKIIVRYLKTTKELELRISNQKPPTLEAYSDATWASDNTDRKSLSGNLFLLGSNPISWMTGKQGCVSLSSTEAELISAAEASQELLWLLDLLKDLELEQKAPIYLHQDNQSCLKICSSEKVSSRTKHIATKIHHLKDLQKKTVIKMIYCPTGDMKADILTKPLPRPTFEKLRYNLV
ncbi:hypothetical protein LAZ67_13000650, partial [Cordylochernes scorpioides]